MSSLSCVQCFVFTVMWTILCLTLNSEYLVGKTVHSAYQQDLVVQGVQCVLYKFDICIVQVVQFVLFKVCSVHGTKYQVCSV